MLNVQNIYLHDIESVYKIESSKKFIDKLHIKPEELLDFAIELKNNFNIKERYGNDSLSDMLLFEYGVSYDCYEGKGLRFNLNITRQVSIKNNMMNENEYNIYQLSMMLCYDPANFDNIDEICKWSKDFSTLNEFINAIEKTKGFLIAKTLIPIDFKIHLVEI